MVRDEKKLQTHEEDDIIRYSLGDDVPVIGLVRNTGEYRETREIALIYGALLGIRKGPKQPTTVEPAEPVRAPEPPTPTPKLGDRIQSLDGSS